MTSVINASFNNSEQGNTQWSILTSHTVHLPTQLKGNTCYAHSKNYTTVAAPAFPRGTDSTELQCCWLESVYTGTAVPLKFFLLISFIVIIHIIINLMAIIVFIIIVKLVIIMIIMTIIMLIITSLLLLSLLFRQRQTQRQTDR